MNHEKDNCPDCGSHVNCDPDYLRCANASGAADTMMKGNHITMETGKIMIEGRMK